MRRVGNHLWPGVVRRGSSRASSRATTAWSSTRSADVCAVLTRAHDALLPAERGEGCLLAGATLPACALEHLLVLLLAHALAALLDTPYWLPTTVPILLTGSSDRSSLFRVRSQRRWLRRSRV